MLQFQNFDLANMIISVIRENKILAKMFEITVTGDGLLSVFVAVSAYNCHWHFFAKPVLGKLT